MKKKEFLQSLLKISGELRAKIEAEVTGFDADPAAVAARRTQVLDKNNGFEYFVNNYFPHYIKKPGKSELHRYLFQRLPEIIRSGESESDAIAAPRGEAKSTIVTQLFVLWCVVCGYKKYALIVMDSIEQAYPMLEAIKAELEANPRLRCDFAEACGQGRIWQAGMIITANDAKIQAAGSGKKIRGLRHGAQRPDVVVLDDIENDEQVNSPEQRDKLQSWLEKTITPLGGAGEKLDIVYIGTILHYDSVLSRMLNNEFWTARKFKAVVQWPDDMVLWEKWEEIRRNAGRKAARAFYQANETAMLKGAVTSWSARGILELMTIRAKIGLSSFASEYQNDPLAGDDAPFANSIIFWVNRLPDWIYYGACDPSLGKAGKARDPSALLVGGYDRKNGVLDVVEAQIKKRLPDRIISDIIALQKQYHCQSWAIETVQFQEFFKTELVKRSAQLHTPIPAIGVKPIADKLLRIESIQPHMQNGLIRLHPNQTVLIDQLRHFPRADHDDGADALQMLWMLVQTRSAQIEFTRVEDDDFPEFRSKWR
ncbi:Phage protein [Snodgrassella communis]|uniref:phage terminase large subunit n=1 Tax=Snodgrassella communis TaxID=2946699 RepID=UPI000461BD4F|nr:phage terminase large subunit [Snodgrassella communis]KDN12573.1 Phage protein [Snodgrassella communis]